MNISDTTAQILVRFLMETTESLVTLTSRLPAFWVPGAVQRAISLDADSSEPKQEPI